MKTLITLLLTLLTLVSAAPAYATVCDSAWFPHHALGALGYAATTVPALLAPEGRVGIGVGVGFEAQEVSGSREPEQLGSGIATTGRASGDWRGPGYDVSYRSVTASSGSCSSRGRTHATIAASYGWKIGEIALFRVGTGPLVGLENSESLTLGLGGFARLTADLPIILLDLELHTNASVVKAELFTTLIPTARMTLDIPYSIQPYAQADYAYVPESSFFSDDPIPEREIDSTWSLTLGASYQW